MRNWLLLSASARLIGSLIAGVVVGVLVAGLGETLMGVLAGIATAATLFVSVGWLALWLLDAAQTEANARREDFQPVVGGVHGLGCTASRLAGWIRRCRTVEVGVAACPAAERPSILATTINLVAGIVTG
ncbi:hypothetical protein AB0B25_19430 [Nocardia sp. NPDC049190]|uniref:hypothetical protein n=1 Tax=Nocardia sp. NPDC049190 TaxID=3155650 RepID=UPI0033F35934